MVGMYWVIKPRWWPFNRKNAHSHKPMHVLLWGNEIDKLYGNFLWVVPTRWHSSRFVPGDVPARGSASTENPRLFGHVLDLPLSLNLMLVSLQHPGPVLYSIPVSPSDLQLLLFSLHRPVWCMCRAKLCIGHQLRVAICDRWSAIRFLREHLGAYTG